SSPPTLLKTHPIYPNQRREIRRVVCRLSRCIDVLTLLQFWKSKTTCYQTSPVIQQFIQCAVQYKPIIPGLLVWHVGSKLLVERSRAVPGQLVVPLRMISQFVEVGHVRKKHGPRYLRSCLYPVHVNFLILPVVGAQSNDITLIGSYKDQPVLPKQAKNW